MSYKPQAVIGILKIEEVEGKGLQDYTLVQLAEPDEQGNDQVYIPYDYMKAKHPKMIMNFLTKRLAWKRYV